MIVVATVAMAVVALGPAYAVAQTCMFDGRDFDPESVSCQGGQQFRCSSGRWQATGLGCARENPAGDGSDVQVAPGVGEPAVRDPRVNDPAVRQPSPPTIPR
jgi:hypothetical protein